MWDVPPVAAQLQHQCGGGDGGGRVAVSPLVLSSSSSI